METGPITKLYMMMYKAHLNSLKHAPIVYNRHSNDHPLYTLHCSPLYFHYLFLHLTICLL